MRVARQAGHALPARATRPGCPDGDVAGQARPVGEPDGIALDLDQEARGGGVLESGVKGALDCALPVEGLDVGAVSGRR
jgi:hypothetical protein